MCYIKFFLKLKSELLTVVSSVFFVIFQKLSSVVCMGWNGRQDCSLLISLSIDIRLLLWRQCTVDLVTLLS